MRTRVDEIAPDVFRISTFSPDFGIQFNQFLVRDEQPFLMHTGMRRMFEATLGGVRQVIDPDRLRWIGVSHFEPDECGAQDVEPLPTGDAMNCPQKHLGRPLLVEPWLACGGEGQVVDRGNASGVEDRPADADVVGEVDRRQRAGQRADHREHHGQHQP